MPLGTESAAVVIADIKSRGYDSPQTGYGQFVIARSLRPEMDMKEFAKLWETVTAKRYADESRYRGRFKATHHLIGDGLPKDIQILREYEHHIDWITEDGMQGGTPRFLIQSLTKIEE